MEYRHIGAQDVSQVIWQSGDCGIVGSGDREGKGGQSGDRGIVGSGDREKEKKKIIALSQECNIMPLLR